MTPAACFKERAAPTSAPSSTKCSSTSSPSSQRKKPCRRACSPGAGATSGGPPWGCASSVATAQGLPEISKFVGNLLKLREKGTDLHTVEIKFDGFSQEDDLPYVLLWIRSALICKVRSLTLHHLGPILYLDTDQHSGPFLCELDGSHLASPYLRTLDLESVALEYTFLDFASCPALEDLKLHKCDMCDLKISSSSLKHLSITDCHSDYCRLHVSAPGLVSLRLDNFWGITPFLENTVLLETAWVNLGLHCQGTCCNYFQYGIYCRADNPCLSCEDYSGELVLLGGISSARHLELISEFQNIIFSRDLEHRPVFSNLKTLLVNEYWCVPPAGCDRLACLLKNSPVLEKLTLQLFSKGPNHEVEIKGSYGTMERPPAISEHLKIVEVKCNAVDDRILEVLKFLRAFNIRFSSE